jgi:hypothetical protein
MLNKLEEMTRQMKEKDFNVEKKVEESFTLKSKIEA